MPTDASRSARPAPPERWRAALDEFELQLERGAPPDLSRCLRLSDGDELPLVAELVATYQSYRTLRGGELVTAISELVQANPGLRGLISQAVGELSTVQLDCVRLGSATSVDLPRRLGSYLLVEALGKGGFSEVFLGCNAASAEFVVVKVARGDAACEALRQEKHALLQLRGQEGISRYVDWHEAPPGEAALVTEFAAARPLNLLRQGEDLDARRVTEWMIGLCKVLQAAHRAGVHHCDLKPQNILIDDASDQPVVIDFGLAQTLVRWSREAPGPAPPVGTLHYLAPELLHAPAGADPRLIDCFGLGAVLFFLLTGEAPFQAGETATALDRVERYDIDFERLDAAPFPTILKTICRRAIAEAPAARYQSPDALRIALLASELATPLRRRRRVPWVAGAAIAIAMSALAAVMLDPSDEDLLSQQGVSHEATSNGALQMTTEAEQPPRPPKESAPPADFKPMEVLPAAALTEPLVPTLAPEPSWITQVAAQQEISLAALDPSSFAVAARSALPSVRPWGSRDHDPARRGVLQVTIAPEMVSLADALEFRVGGRRWRALKRTAQATVCEGDLTAIDLDDGSALELRLGGLSEEVAAGPFSYPLTLSKLVAEDEEEFVNRLVEEARSADCFEPVGSDWQISSRFAARYGPVIKSFRFGASLGDPLKELPFATAEDAPHLQSAPSFLNASDLRYEFSRTVQELQHAPELWTEIDWVNGWFSGPCRYLRPNPAFQAEANNARQRLAAAPPDEPVAVMRNVDLLPLRLLPVAEALESVEIGESRESFPIRVPVICDANLESTNSILSRPPPKLNRDGIIGSCKPSRIPALYCHDGQLLAPINVPPIWRGAYFRGRFRDGSTTDTYFAENLAPAVGFQLTSLAALDGSPITEGYLVFAIGSEDEKHTIAAADYIWPANIDRPQTEVHRPIGFYYFVRYPRGVGYFGGPKYLTPPRSKDFMPFIHIIEVSYLDRYGRQVGTGMFRINSFKIHRAITELLTKPVAGTNP